MSFTNLEQMITMRDGSMDKIKQVIFAAGLASILLAASPGYAAGEGFYWGAMLGATSTNNLPKDVYNDDTNADNDNDIEPDNDVQKQVVPTNTGLGGRLFLGVNISKYAGVEFGYTHFANSTYTADKLNKSPEIQENGVDLMVKAMYPIRSFGVFGKLGLAYTRSSQGGSLQPPQDSTEKNHSITNHIGPAIGAGVFYDFTPNWEVDLSANRYLKGSNGFQNADLVALGFSYHFVTLYCGQFVC